MRICPVSSNWRQNTRRNCRFSWSWRLLLTSKTCPKNRAQQSCCSKLASKDSAQLSICLNLASFVHKQKRVKKIARNCPVAVIGIKTLWQTVVVLEIGFFKKAKLVQNIVRNCPVARNWRQKIAQLSICLKLASFVNKLKLVQNTVRNCPVAWNRPQNTLRN